jgi:ribosomal protein S27E
MGKVPKITYEFVKAYIESFRYMLLSTEYKNSHTKLSVRCPEGHEYEVTWNSFKKGRRCPICNKINKGIKLRFSYDYVKEYIELFGYKFLSEEYKNSRVKLKLKCPNGHVYNTRFDTFKSGGRCKKCLNERRKLVYEDVKEYIESFGYTLLSTEYKTAKSYLKVKCPNGHEYKVKYNNFKQGQRCLQCFYEDMKLTYEDVKKYIENCGFVLKSKEYISSDSLLEIECTEGHIFEICWNNFQQRKRCPICNLSKITSIAEKEICEYVKELINCEVEENNRTQIINPFTKHNLELDIWIPELNKAIEYNGTYWHSNKYSKFKDKIKIKQCKQKGIDLLVIEEQDYIENKQKILEEIRIFML